MKLKLSEIVDFYEGLKLLSDIESEFDFSYAVAKNKRIAKSYVEVLEDKFKASKEFEEYQQKRLKLATEMAEVDENDQPVIRNNSYVIKKELRAEFKTKFEELKTEYKLAIEAQKELLDKQENTLNEEKEVDFYLISKTLLPKLTPKQMDVVLYFLKEE